jgi:hypothetical protein
MKADGQSAKRPRLAIAGRSADFFGRGDASEGRGNLPSAAIEHFCALRRFGFPSAATERPAKRSVSGAKPSRGRLALSKAPRAKKAAQQLFGSL